MPLSSGSLHSLSPHFSVPTVPPTISSEGRVVEAAVGQPVELPCLASGNPLPTLSWQKDGQPLPQGAGVLLLAGGTLLRVQRVSESSGGSYTCLASSPTGESVVRHTLLVQGKGAAGLQQGAGIYGGRKEVAETCSSSGIGEVCVKFGSTQLWVLVYCWGPVLSELLAAPVPGSQGCSQPAVPFSLFPQLPPNC